MKRKANEEKQVKRFMRAPEVEDATGWSRTTLWRAVHASEFPAPVQLGKNSIGWYADEVDAWVGSRPRVFYSPKKKKARG